MGMTEGAPQFTCDVCGASVDISQVVSYKVVLAMPGNGGSAVEGQQIFACQIVGHAVQAAQNSLSALEAQRTATP